MLSRLLEWFDVTPMVQKASLFGLFMVLCGGGFYWVVAEPLLVQVDGAKMEIHDLEEKLHLYARSDGQIGKTKEELSQWESLVSRQTARLGLDVPMSQVLSDMSHIADEAGILLTLWKPDQQESGDGEPRVVRHLQLHIEGGYHHVAQFLDRTQYLSKMMGVLALTMDRVDSDDKHSTVRTTIDFVGYEEKSPTLANHHKESTSPSSLEGKG